MSSIKEVSLRRATVADAEAIAAVRVEGWQTAYRGMIPDQYLDEMLVDDHVLYWKRILQALPAAADKACVYVAESEGHVIGFVSATLLAEPKHGYHAELGALYIRPQWQRAGIGRRMMHKVARTLQSWNCADLVVWVLSDNRLARNFYEELNGEFVLEQEFSWDDMDLKEVGYGWKDLNVLLASVNAVAGSAAVH
ncbi:GNAT family N-acetyltransferase [Undibacterium luofuense]|jgi:ribosomal protein S18 acetylase RimI-like enzyme|uniref:GNAT family N-acetyltransferase n=1 Tax=Undibacterium luofuense TaxID=2828733 RepID=A0A941DQ91_9BURK|nr:GNAT family N-acetyltransferase [Undibacterium luofuense]MBR7782901.1 GNAT family N-acetyltransferase [Undibacterium luofuense]